MRTVFPIVFALSVVFCRADGPAPTSSPGSATPPNYSEFVAQLFTPADLQDFIAQSDALVESVDAPDTHGSLSQAKTKRGLELQFTIQRTNEAILYYFAVSRGGAPLRYSDAVKLMALFCDRCGLPHPVDVTEGERDIYYAQWLFQPKEFKKKIRKKMLEVRTASRAEKEPIRALAIAVQRELETRASIQRANEH